MDEVVTVIPATHFNVETVEYKFHSLGCWWSR